MKDKNGKVLTNHQIISKVANRFNTVALEFWLMVLRFVGHLPFHSVRQIFYIASGLKMPFLRSHIHMWANFFNPANITIGTGTIIGDHCFLDGRDLLIIGNHVNIASQVLIYNDEHDINSPGFGNSFGKVIIDDYVFVGPRAIILPGVHIGRGAVVAAGAIVTKDIPPFEVWGGVPAKKITDRQLTKPEYRLGRPMLFQ